MGSLWTAGLLFSINREAGSGGGGGDGCVGGVGGDDCECTSVYMCL